MQPFHRSGIRIRIDAPPPTPRQTPRWPRPLELQALEERLQRTVTIAGACVDAQIDGGDGNDYIDCSRNLCGVVVHGGAGNDTLTGSAFNDQLYGDSGNDSMYGGVGSDAFYLTDPGDRAVDADMSDS